ncbi:DUF58 domain-containing protein [Leifsonia shinshuensis]|uniref:DUF58 domain-containing protein n=1 Tax=Leifsonia shinshuensis TaxID=150026 RepID=A0A7G6Y7P9_9MICO|nr:DUF58 domain-containing protein [Leifsonia shinshuensis]QNE34514.1 DUF58 domain-containing protein [Leifsonia shinshuensis]
MAGRWGPSPLKKPRPTARGWTFGAVGVVALAASALFGRTDVLFIGVFLTVLPLAAMISVTLDRPRLTVARTFHPDIVAVGEQATIVTTARNQSTRPSPPARWREYAPAGVEVQRSAPFPRLGAHQVNVTHGRDTVVLRQDVVAYKRGSHPVGPLIVSRTDPFGVAYAEYALGQPRQLLVTPRVVPLTSGELDVAHSEGAEHELQRHSIPSADELIAREYRPGDPLRRVHWRATARHDKLMVRQEEQRSNPEAWILMDTRPAPTPPGVIRPATRSAYEPEDELFETLIELVASVGVHLLDEGFVLSVVETAPRQLSGRSGAGRTGTLGSVTPTYDRGAADRLLLADLAAVDATADTRDDAVAELASGLRRAGRSVPIFAALLDGSPELGSLAGLRGMGDPAVAFIGETAGAEVEEVLADAGWLCVPFSVGDDPAECWQRALDRQRAVVGHG